MPVLTNFAGPNGLGKSSIIRALTLPVAATCSRQTQLQSGPILEIHERRPSQPSAKSFFEREDRSMPVRTSPPRPRSLGAWTIKAIKLAIAQGFLVRLAYLCLESLNKAFSFESAGRRTSSRHRYGKRSGPRDSRTVLASAARPQSRALPACQNWRNARTSLGPSRCIRSLGQASEAHPAPCHPQRARVP